MIFEAIATIVACSTLLSCLESRKKNSFPRKSQIRPRKKKGKVVSTRPLVNDKSRENQLLEFLPPAQFKELQNRRAQLRNKFLVSVGTTGLATVTTFAAPGLVWLSLPGILFVAKDTITGAYNKLVYERRFSVDLISSITKILLVASGFFILAGITTIVHTSNRLILDRVKERSKRNLIDIFRTQPRKAWVVVDGSLLELPISQVKAGDIVQVSAGEVIPVDGEIVQGLAIVDQAMLTGEGTPCEKGSGDTAYATTLVLKGKLRIAAHSSGVSTIAAQIGDALNNSMDTKTVAQIHAETFADRTVMPTLLLSGACIPFFGLPSAMAVLLSHFKYRVSIVSAIGLLNHLNAASRQGVLVKDGRALEELDGIDTIVFDKTGTLTEEVPELEAVHVCAGVNENDLLRMAAAAEARQTHPIAQAIRNEAHRRKLELPAVDESSYFVGRGLEVTIGGRKVALGSKGLLQDHGIDQNNMFNEIVELALEKGNTVVFLAVNHVLQGAIELQPRIRPEIEELLAKLRGGGVQQILIASGDAELPTKFLANRIGVDGYIADVLPQGKADYIRELQRDGSKVCFVGDGINDCLAMKEAHVSVSLKGASTLATDMAQIVFAKGDLAQFSALFELSRSYRCNARRSTACVILPCGCSMFGVLFLGFGFSAAMMLPQLGIALGVAVSLLPVAEESDQLKLKN